ncbi:MAG: YdeI/OmpD-associated family protein [Planctomycetota bacterium]
MASRKRAISGPAVDPRVDAYISSQPDFARPLLEKIRAAFHAGCPDLVETIKWGVPSFERSKMLGGMAAFKEHVSFGFWRAADMDDPEGILGETRKQSPMRIQVRSARDLPTKKVLVAYVKQAAALDAEAPPKKAAARGTAKKKAAQLSTAAKPPKDMLDAIVANTAAHAFWKSLAPGYRRDYVEWVTEAKREATRAKRLATTVEWLAEGKRRNWKYESC